MPKTEDDVIDAGASPAQAAPPEFPRAAILEAKTDPNSLRQIPQALHDRLTTPVPGLPPVGRDVYALTAETKRVVPAIPAAFAPDPRRMTGITFYGALKAVVSGYKATRRAWNDPATYMLVVQTGDGDYLGLHRDGEDFTYSLRLADVQAEDWTLLTRAD